MFSAHGHQPSLKSTPTFFFFMAATATPFPSLDVGPLAAKPLRLAMLGRSHKLQQGALNSLAFV